MAFDWLNRFQHRIEKEPGYAEKALAAYALGMKANGSIVGVVIEPAPDCCAQIRQLTPAQLYQPREAPLLPLAGCPLRQRCGCVYRPVMSYQRAGEATGSSR